MACQEGMCSESSEPLAGRLGAPAQRRHRRHAVKSRCAREWGGWGRLSDDGPGHYNPDERGPLGRRCNDSKAVHDRALPDRRLGGRRGSQTTEFFDFGRLKLTILDYIAAAVHSPSPLPATVHS
jgi:hypothetical protein